MANSLVIVESPTIPKSLPKYLGRNYQVIASVGHLKDLPKSKLGIDLEHKFDGSVAKNRFVRYATGFHVGPS